MQESIARYREKRFDGQRTFELFEDRVVVVAKTWSGDESEQSVALVDLMRVPDRARARDRSFATGIWMCLVGTVLLQSGLLSIHDYLGGLTLCVSIGGGLMAIATWRRIRWVMFGHRNGGHALTIAAIGPDASSFEDFVERVIAGINAAQNADASP